MHSFHHSRGRILFEVFCALAIAASCVGAWIQTGASAFLPAAFVAALYGLIHAFDMAGHRSPTAMEPQRIEFTSDDRVDPLAHKETAAPLKPADKQMEAGNIKETELVEPPAPRSSRSRKTSGKKGGRQASVPKEAKVTEVVPPEQAVITELALTQEAEVAVPVPPEEMAHVPYAPLFEPEPFVRQQRTVFGRKAG